LNIGSDFWKISISGFGISDLTVTGFYNCGCQNIRFSGWKKYPELEFGSRELIEINKNS
jgi:hypothetical protein